MPTLTSGANAKLGASSAEVRVEGPVDLVALVLNADGKVSGDADMIFFNQPTAPGTELGDGTLTVHPAQLRAGASKVVLAASPADESKNFGQIGSPQVQLVSGETYDFAFGDLSTQTLLVLCELYERNGEWKVRSVGQGYDTGLRGLALDHGVDISEDSAPETPPVQQESVRTQEVVSQPVSALRFSKGEDKMPAADREKLNLQKKLVGLSLVKAGADSDIQGEIQVASDASGSMTARYKGGAKSLMARTIRRIVPISAQLDPDSTLQAWTYGTNPAQLPDITLPVLNEWLDLHVRVGEWGAKKPAKLKSGQVDMRYVGGSNNEPAMMRMVRAYNKQHPSRLARMVIVFSDGGVHQNKEIEREVRESVDEGIFWSFVGVGRANFGILQRLNDLTGRKIDNTGFIHVPDPDDFTDEQLYDLLLSEFPSYVREAKRLGIIS